MSTKTEPYRKYVAHDEKSKFFIFFQGVTYGKPRNVVWFFSWNMLSKARENQKSVTVPRLVKNTQNSVTIKLIINFALFNPYQNNTPVWAWKVYKSFEANYTEIGFCGLIFMATTSRLKSLKFAS